MADQPDEDPQDQTKPEPMEDEEEEEEEAAPGAEQDPATAKPQDAAQPTANQSASVQIIVGPQLVQEAVDALELLNFVVSSGYVPEDGRQLLPTTIVGIKSFVVTLGLPDNAPDPARRTIDAPEASALTTSSQAWIDFESHYRDLALYAAPITSETLRNTELRPDHLFVASNAQRFAWRLWTTTLIFAVVIIAAEWGMRWFEPVEGVADIPNGMLQLATILQPYLYGGLGACAYLLRSAHTYVYKRSFDMRRTSEYFNRILLGAVSGGAIIILIDSITDSDGNTVQIGAAALGFIAGYSTDFLFNTVERIVNAIMPKIDVSSLPKRPPPPAEKLEIATGDLTLKELLDRHEAAKGPEKELYQSLIQKLATRL